MPIPKQVIGEASGWWLTHSIRASLSWKYAPIASRSCKRTPCILAKWGSLGSADESYPIHAQLFDKLLNLWHLKGLTMHQPLLVLAATWIPVNNSTSSSAVRYIGTHCKQHNSRYGLSCVGAHP